VYVVENWPSTDELTVSVYVFTLSNTGTSLGISFLEHATREKSKAINGNDAVVFIFKVYARQNNTRFPAFILPDAEYECYK